MSCRDLDAFHDGELTPRAARAFEAHLGGCGACRAALEATRAMVAGLRQLPEPPEPSDFLFRKIARELDRPEPRRAATRWLAWAGPMAVAAAAAGGALLFARREPAPPAPVLAGAPEQRRIEEAFAEVFAAEGELRRALAELDRVVEDERSSWPPEVSAQFADSSRQMDAAIARMREAALARPGDAEAQDALYALYRQKIDFVQEMVLRGGTL